MSKEIKESVAVEIPAPEFDITVITAPTVQGAKVAKVQTLSPLAAARRTLIQDIDGNVKSLSSYFKELRRNHENLQKFIVEAQAKGRRFDAEKVHSIINLGTLSLLTREDDAIQAGKDKPAKNWSGTRLFQAFIRATEIKTVKS